MPDQQTEILKKVAIIQKAFTLSLSLGHEAKARLFGQNLSELKLTSPNSVPKPKQLFHFNKSYKKAYEYLRSHGEA